MQHSNPPSPGEAPEFATIYQEQPHAEKCGGDRAVSTALPASLEHALAEGWQIGHAKFSPLPGNPANKVHPEWFDSFTVQPAQPLDVNCELVLFRWNDEAEAWESLRLPVQLTARVAGPPCAYQREPSRMDRELAAVCRAVEATIRDAVAPPNADNAA